MRNYQVAPIAGTDTLQIGAGATDQIVMAIQSAANKVVEIMSIMITATGNLANEEMRYALREITTPGGGGAFANVEPVDPGDAAFSGTILVSSTAITGTLGNRIAQGNSSVRGAVQLFAPDESGVLARLNAGRPLALVCEQGSAAVHTPVVSMLLREIG